MAQLSIGGAALPVFAAMDVHSALRVRTTFPVAMWNQISNQKPRRGHERGAREAWSHLPRHTADAVTRRVIYRQMFRLAACGFSFPLSYRPSAPSNDAACPSARLPRSSGQTCRHLSLWEAQQPITRPYMPYTTVCHVSSPILSFIQGRGLGVQYPKPLTRPSLSLVEFTPAQRVSRLGLPSGSGGGFPHGLILCV